MKISRIAAKNFRTLEDFNLALKTNYCAISGKNNAGKSAVVKIIQHFFELKEDNRFLFPSFQIISFSKDRTQWSSSETMEVSISVEINRSDDSEVFFVVEKYSNTKFDKDNIIVSLTQVFGKDTPTKTSCTAAGIQVEEQGALEILKKFRSSSNLITHNSTNPNRGYYFGHEGYTEVLDAHFSPEDRKKIVDAEKNLQAKIKHATKQHKEELSKLLGKLNEKYQVELTTIESGRSSNFPLEIKLTDKSVEVPLADWGAGTQNRTRVLISVLDAVRNRSSVTAVERSSPVFLVEEPESFLHPSAQAEFGQVLNSLADELRIQIIATTHSPYMLNQTDSSANVLLERKMFRKAPRETQIKETSGDNWMIPFAECLGIVPHEFSSWKGVFGAQSNKVILVEGEIDKKYFEHFRDNYASIYKIPANIEIVPYGGKDALKNTAILKFMISKFAKVFVTYDLDADNEVRPSLERIGLEAGRHFCSIGKTEAGCSAIEGLLPASIKRSVYADKHELVTALTSQDTKTRNSARQSLKTELLTEFIKSRVEDKHLGDFKALFSSIGKVFSP